MITLKMSISVDFENVKLLFDTSAISKQTYVFGTFGKFAFVVFLCNENQNK